MCYFLLCATGVGAYFGAECQKNGMLVRVSGDTIMMSPPFIISPQEVDEVSLKANNVTIEKFQYKSFVGIWSTVFVSS